MFHFLLTCFILIPPPPSPSYLPCLILFLFTLSWFILISALTDLSSLTIPYEEEEEEEEEEEKEEEEEMYDDIDGFDSSNSGSQSRPVILPGSVGLKEAMEEKEEDIYEILPGETFRLLTTFLWFRNSRPGGRIQLGQLQRKPNLWRRHYREASVIPSTEALPWEQDELMGVGSVFYLCTWSNLLQTSTDSRVKNTHAGSHRFTASFIKTL